MKFRIFAVAAALSVISLLFPLLSLAQNEFHLSNEFALTYNDVSGPGAESSSLTEGIRHLNIFNMYGNGKATDFDYSYSMGFKLTDDPRNDVKQFSLTNMQGRISSLRHVLTLGDTFESFSQYSLSTALKGGSYRYKGTDGVPEVVFVYGYAYPRWDSMWKDSKTQTIERLVYGGRIKQDFSQEFQAGLNAVWSYDDDRVNSTDALYDNRVMSADFQYRPIPGLVITAEAAFNAAKLSQQEGDPYDKSHGSAYKISATGDGPPSRVTIEYERIDPDFITLTGAATADREKFKFKWKYKTNKTTTINSGFLWYRNNLENQRSSGRTDTYRPDIGINVRRIFNRQYASADFSYKLNIATNAGVTTKEDHTFNLNYRDRFGIIDNDTNFGVTFYETGGTSAAKSHEFIFNTSLNSRHTVGMFILRPAVYLGGWTMRDELADNTDRIYEYSLGLGADIPGYKITSNLKFGQNRLDKDGGTGDDTSKVFANFNLFYSPKVLSKLNQGMLFLRCYINDFRYTTGTRNFRETSITAGINIQI